MGVFRRHTSIRLPRSVQVSERGILQFPNCHLENPWQSQCAHFLECIVTEKQPLTGGREGIAVVRALEAIQRSIRAGGREEQVELS